MPMRSILGGGRSRVTMPEPAGWGGIEQQRRDLRRSVFGNREITDSMMSDQRYTDWYEQDQYLANIQQQRRDSGMGAVMASQQRRQQERQALEAAEAERAEAEAELGTARREAEAARERRAQLVRRRARASLQATPSLFSQLGGT